jgi:hypothetical protein
VRPTRDGRLEGSLSARNLPAGLRPALLVRVELRQGYHNGMARNFIIDRAVSAQNVSFPFVSSAPGGWV